MLFHWRRQPKQTDVPTILTTTTTKTTGADNQTNSVNKYLLILSTSKYH